VQCSVIYKQKVFMVSFKIRLSNSRPLASCIFQQDMHDRVSLQSTLVISEGNAAMHITIILFQRILKFGQYLAKVWALQEFGVSLLWLTYIQKRQTCSS